MLKPDSLRAALTASILAPDGARLIERDPAMLRLFVDQGRVVAHLGPSHGFEYRYRLNVLLIGFPAGSPNAITLPLLTWLRVNQPDLLQNHGKAAQAIAFQVDVIDAGTVDVEFQLELTEAVRVTPRAGGGHDLHHVAEPPLDWEFPGVSPGPPLREVYYNDELLVAAPDG